MNEIKILFLSACPKDQAIIRYDEEIHAIEEALERSPFKNSCLKPQLAIRSDELASSIMKHKPNIVHFSGHGNEDSEIILKDNMGNSQALSGWSLKQLFYAFRDRVKLVFLNACFSRAQAGVIVENIDCVIGMTSAISDDAAIKFAASFYQALAYGESVKTAFDLGCVAVDIANLDEKDTPKLLHRPSCDPTKVFFAEKITDEDKPNKTVYRAAVAKNEEKNTSSSANDERPIQQYRSIPPTPPPPIPDLLSGRWNFPGGPYLVFQKQAYDYAVMEFNMFGLQVGQGSARANGNNITINGSNVLGPYTANLVINGYMLQGTVVNMYNMVQSVIAYRG